MRRLIPHTDMNAAQIVDCSYQALALVDLCENAAWTIQNGGNAETLSDAIGAAMRLARELLEPVHDALERHEGIAGGSIESD